MRHTCPSAPCHAGDAALLLGGDMKSSWGFWGGRSSHGDRQRFIRRGRAGPSSFLFFSPGVGQPAKELKEQWHSRVGESHEDKPGLVNCADPSRARSSLHPACCPTHRGASCSLGPRSAGTPPACSPSQQADAQTFIILPLDHSCCVKHSGQHTGAAGAPVLLAGELLAGEGTVPSPCLYQHLRLAKPPFLEAAAWLQLSSGSYPAPCPHLSRAGPLPHLGTSLGASCAVPSPVERVPAGAAGLRCRPTRLPPARNHGRCSPGLRRTPLAQGAAEPREERDGGSFMSPARNFCGATGSS